ncbi:MAG: sulfatase [Planctomycetota bacterium]
MSTSLMSIRAVLCCLTLLLGLAMPTPVVAETRPNIVWLMAEDISTELACYSEAGVETPNLDRLASQGKLYEKAFCTAPSCTPSRNAMMTGVYQTRTDTQDQRRSGITLPDGIVPITQLLRDAGYYTALGCSYSTKTDLNFDYESLFDGRDWSQRDPDQPFFAQITLYGTHRNPGPGWDPVRKRSTDPVEPAEVELPPYYPDHPVCRLDWAKYLDSIEEMDGQVGDVLARLEREGIADNTLVIFIGDNGRCHLRGKCWLYDPGLHVPLLVRWPGRVPTGSVEPGLVSMLDVTATVLDAAGASMPAYLDGRPLLGPNTKPRDHVFAARDKIDEIEDTIRCVRTDRYKYIRNYRPELGYRECEYVRENRPMLPVIERLAAAGQLSDAQQLIVAETKPREELYDLQADPHELTNLADSPELQSTLNDLRSRLDDWLGETGDTGLARWQLLNTPGGQ